MSMPMSLAAAAGGEQPDAALIEQILGGNTAIFELLMRRYNERVYRAARAIVRDEQEAEDVMQQAYVNAFAHLRQFNGSASFSTWLTRIAINEALARRLQDAGGRLGLCGMGDAVRQVFQLAGFLPLFVVLDTREAALHQLARP